MAGESNIKRERVMFSISGGDSVDEEPSESSENDGDTPIKIKPYVAENSQTPSPSCQHSNDHNDRYSRRSVFDSNIYKLKYHILPS